MLKALQAGPSNAPLYEGSDDDLRAKMERYKQMLTCWNVAFEGGAVEDEDDIEEVTILVQEVASNIPVTAGPYVALQALLQNGATFKSSPEVAVAQLAIDARLPGGPRLNLGPAERQQVSDTITLLHKEVEAELQNAADFQEELATEIAAEVSTLAKKHPTGIAAKVCGLGMELRHPYQLASAYQPTPAFTNFVGTGGGYEATLDWIIFDKQQLRRMAEAPTPPREVVEEATALPSERFPSDHLLLAADLSWQDSDRQAKAE